MSERWETTLELTFDVDPEDVKYRHEGDAEVDYSARAIERIRPALGDLITKGPFAHFRIISNKRVFED